MAETVLGIFDSAGEAGQAVASLVEAGFSRDSIAVMSSEPVHVAPNSNDEPRSRIGLFSVAGGFLGAIAAVLLTTIPTRSMNLVTGGMPIVTPWAFGIVVFELTALGAVLMAFGRMIFESRLARPSDLEQYDAAVSDGKVAVAVTCDESSGHLARALLGTRRGADQ